MTTVLIGLGSNLGDRKATLDFAVQKLRATRGILQVQVSSYHDTQAIGGPEGQPSFLNAAARIETSFQPLALLRELQRIENESGRKREMHWGPRTLDLDILLFGSKFIEEKGLRIPHRYLMFRRFVLEPLVEIAPKFLLPRGDQSIEDIYHHLCSAPQIFHVWVPIAFLADQLQYEVSKRVDERQTKIRFWRGETVSAWQLHGIPKANLYNFLTAPCFQNMSRNCTPGLIRETSELLEASRPHYPQLVNVPTFQLTLNSFDVPTQAADEIASIVQSMR